LGAVKLRFTAHGQRDVRGGRALLAEVPLEREHGDFRRLALKDPDRDVRQPGHDIRTLDDHARGVRTDVALVENVLGTRVGGKNRRQKPDKKRGQWQPSQHRAGKNSTVRSGCDLAITG
jgi:hypothetical protein